MDLARLEQRIMRDEGYSAVAYQDTVDIWTLGYGSTRMYGRAIKEHDTCTKTTARIQLRADLYQAILDCHKFFSNWDQLDSVRQEILTNMMYNLGMTRLGTFRNMRSALAALNFTLAAQEMVDSKWYRQVGGRGQRLVAAMKAGKWIED